MKKLLFSLITAVGALFSASAADLELCYCNDNDVRILGQGSSYEIGLAQKIAGERLRAYAGAKITSISFMTGRCEEEMTNQPDTWEMNVFVASKLNDVNPAAKFKGNLSMQAEKFTWQEFALPEPVEITDENGDLYFGFIGNTVKLTCPLNINRLGAETGTSYIGLRYGDESTVTWSDCGNIYGQVMVKVKISGDNLPVDCVELTAITAPQIISPGVEYSTNCTFTNRGANEVSSITVKYSVGDAEPVTTDLTMDEPLTGFGKSINVNLPFSYPSVASDMTLSVEAITANGNANANPSRQATCKVNCLDPADLFARKVVMEEYTGVACPNCPFGIYAIEQMTEKYPDEFIPIAIHSSYFGPTTLTSRSYEPGYKSDFNPTGQAPHAMINRTGDGIYPRFSVVEEAFLAERQKLSPVELEIKGITEPADNYDYWKFDIEARFAFTSSEATYRIATVITEDALGPVTQLSNLTGLDHPDAGPWSDYPDAVSILVNHVARDISFFIGNDNSLPASVEKGTVYTYTGKVDKRNVYKPENCTAIAMVINSVTGQIENATKMTFNDLFALTALNDVETAETVAPEADVVYDLQGRRVSNPAHGLYIINGKKTLVK